jgi:hypothetical protein
MLIMSVIVYLRIPANEKKNDTPHPQPHARKSVS